MTVLDVVEYQLLIYLYCMLVTKALIRGSKLLPNESDPSYPIPCQYHFAYPSLAFSFRKQDQRYDLPVLEQKESQRTQGRIAIFLTRLMDSMTFSCNPAEESYGLLN
jgi:hypothetical protein